MQFLQLYQPLYFQILKECHQAKKKQDKLTPKSEISRIIESYRNPAIEQDDKSLEVMLKKSEGTNLISVSDIDREVNSLNVQYDMFLHANDLYDRINRQSSTNYERISTRLRFIDFVAQKYMNSDALNYFSAFSEKFEETKTVKSKIHGILPRIQYNFPNKYEPRLDGSIDEGKAILVIYERIGYEICVCDNNNMFSSGDRIKLRKQMKKSVFKELRLFVDIKEDH